MTLVPRIRLIRRYPHILKRYVERDSAFAPVRRRFYDAYWQHAASRIGARLNSLGGDWFECERDGLRTWVRYHYVGIDSYLCKFLADDKLLMAKAIERLGFNTPSSIEYDLRDTARAEALVSSGGGAFVVKPVSGSGGHGVVTGINSRLRLIEASIAASNGLALPRLMLERQHAGDSYRLLFLDGELLHAVRRGRCSVIGDGRSTIAELVRQDNERRLLADPIDSLSDLRIDLEARYTLADQGLKVGSVPEQNRRIIVKNVSNQNARHDQECVTYQVHVDYHALAQALRDHFGFRLLGIDIMAENIAAPPKQHGAAVIEVNIPPGLNYHEFVNGFLGFSDVGARILGRALNISGQGDQSISLLGGDTQKVSSS